MDGQQNLEAIMGLIMYGGNAKSDAMEAIAAAKSGDFELADKKIAFTDLAKEIIDLYRRIDNE